MEPTTTVEEAVQPPTKDEEGNKTHYTLNFDYNEDLSLVEKLSVDNVVLNGTVGEILHWAMHVMNADPSDAQWGDKLPPLNAASFKALALMAMLRLRKDVAVVNSLDPEEVQALLNLNKQRMEQFFAIKQAQALAAAAQTEPTPEAINN